MEKFEKIWAAMGAILAGYIGVMFAIFFTSLLFTVVTTNTEADALRKEAVKSGAAYWRQEGDKGVFVWKHQENAK